MVTNKTLLVIFVTLASVTAQTFQYSRGWTNGKRDGPRREEVRDISAREVGSNLDKIISPCQMNKLKYLLEGKPYNEMLFVPCDGLDDEMENQKLSSTRRYKAERNPEPLFEVFQ